MTTLRSGSATDVGKVRTSNQDVALEDPDLFAVADGMGGHVGGEVAARVAVDALRSAFQRQPTVEGLRGAVAEANRAVWRQGQSESGLRGMGTTLTATALVEEADGRQLIALANVGDSRAYVYSKGQVIQVTADHSLAEEKVRQGQLTEAEAAVHPHRHILTRALGVSSDVDVDLWELHLHDGDRILLCSDGLTNEIGDEGIGQILGRVGDPSEAAKALVTAALDHGGNDNVTCIVVDVVGAESAAAPKGAGGDAAVATASAAVPAAARGAVTGPRQDGQREGSGDRVGGARSGEAGEPSAGEPSAGHPSAGGAGGAGGAGRAHPNGSTRTLRVVGGTRTPAPARAGARSAAAFDPAHAAPAGDAANGQPPAGQPPAGQGPVLSAARLQAAELRRLQPSRDNRRTRRRAPGTPRLVTFRVVLFVLLFAGILAGAYYAVRWYEMDNWYVAVDHGHLAVYRGRPGGVLWFKPQLVDESSVTTNEVLAYNLPQLRRDRDESSLAAAKSYIRNLHTEYESTKGPSGGTTSSPHKPSKSTPSNSPTSTSGSTPTTTGAIGVPVASWQ